MSDERIEENQPFRIIITCKLNGTLIDLTTGYTAYAIEYKSPAGTETKVTAQILTPPGADGKIYYDVPKNTFNDPRKWEAKPWLTTTGGDELPGDPADIEVSRKWSE